jgi:hypothetical protein
MSTAPLITLRVNGFYIVGDGKDGYVLSKFEHPKAVKVTSKYAGKRFLSLHPYLKAMAFRNDGHIQAARQ